MHKIRSSFLLLWMGHLSDGEFPCLSMLSQVVLVFLSKVEDCKTKLGMHFMLCWVSWKERQGESVGEPDKGKHWNKCWQTRIGRTLQGYKFTSQSEEYESQKGCCVPYFTEVLGFDGVLRKDICLKASFIYL